jgi:hypothetical protein
MYPPFPWIPRGFRGCLPQICHTLVLDFDAQLLGELPHGHGVGGACVQPGLCFDLGQNFCLFRGQSKRYWDRSGNRRHDQRIGTPVCALHICGRILLHHRYVCMQYWYACKRLLERRTGLVMLRFPDSVISPPEREIRHEGHGGTPKYAMCITPFVRDSVPAEVDVLISTQIKSITGYGLSGVDLQEDFCHAYSLDSVRHSLCRLRFRRYGTPFAAGRAGGRTDAHLPRTPLRYKQITDSSEVGCA